MRTYWRQCEVHLRLGGVTLYAVCLYALPGKIDKPPGISDR